MPDYREGGRTFGDFPQVDITLQTTNFANKVRDYVIDMEFQTEVRILPISLY